VSRKKQQERPSGVTSGGRFYSDPEAESLESADETAGDLGAISSTEVDSAEVAILERQS
jgi:hypothetical protein